MDRKRVLIKIYLLGIFFLLTGCSKAEEAKKETYTVQSYSTEYKGFFVSKYIESIECIDFNILLANGSHVKAGTIVAENVIEDNGTLEQLKNDKQSYEENLININQQIEYIQKGDVSKCEEILSSMMDISEQIKELEYNLKENELAKKENKLNYEKQISELDRELQETQQQIEELDKKKLEIKEETELLAEIEKEITVLNQTILKISVDKEYEKQNYQVAEERIILSDNKINEVLGQLKTTNQQLSIADNNNSTVIMVLKSLEEEREICQKNITTLDIQIKEYDVEQIIAPFDAQIEVKDENLIFYSEEKQFIFNATEKQMEMLNKNTNAMQVMIMDGVGNLNLESVLYESSKSDLGNGIYYRMIYNIEWVNEPDTVLYGSSGVMYSEKEIFVPEEYLINEGECYYVIINNQKREVTVESTENGWKIKSGLEEGDVLERTGEPLD